MTTRFFLSEAARELEEAAVFYESRVKGLGWSFTTAVDETLALIERFPDAGAVLASDVRRITLDRFPYSIVYRRDNDFIIVIAVAHHRRRPGYWRGRS